jgi:hypothetical protein
MSCLRSILPLMRFRAEQCLHNIRQGETVRNVLLVVFMAAILPAPRSIASTNLFAEIDADALNKLIGRGFAVTSAAIRYSSNMSNISSG